MSCLILTPGIKALAAEFPSETEQSVLNLVGLWQEKNKRSLEDIPSSSVLKDFIKELRKPSNIGWARTSDDSYEVSTRGDKRFSALVATFKEGTIIDGVDVGGKTIEDVYQNVIKKSGKGKAPASDSKLNLTPIRSGQMTFSYGTNKRNDVTSSTTLDAIRNRERTATTRYSSDGHIDYWKDLKIGDIVEFKGKNPKDKVLVRITKPLTKLPTNTSAEEWSKKEGWSVDYFNNKVRPKLAEAYQMEYEYVGENNKESIEDFSYTEGYLPLWKEWAKQNPQLIDELKKNTAGKTLTDQFANTRVSQARALSEILNESEAQTTEEGPRDSFSAPNITTLEEQQRVNLDFDPITRRDRVGLIARFFSHEIDKALQEQSSNLNRKREEALNNGETQRAQELAEDMQSLSRFSIIRLYTPGGIFNRVKKLFSEYVEDSEENRIQAELESINSRKGADKYSDEQKYEAAKRKALYKTGSYQKIIDNFRVLAEEASSLLTGSEGISVDPNYVSPKEADLNYDTPEGDSVLDGMADDSSKEESVKDGWMNKFREVSQYESLSQETRKVLRNIPRLDYKGRPDRDDLGNLRYLEAENAHAVLLEKLKDMVSSEDMVPMLEKAGESTPWIRQVVKKIQSDPRLFSQFYHDFRKDFTSYWIQKKKYNSDGTFKVETIAINRAEGISYLLDEWRSNYENGHLLDDDSVYEKNGTLNTGNAEKGLKWTRILNDKFSNLDTDQKNDLLKEERIWKTINKLLSMVGISANPGTLMDSLVNDKHYEGGTATSPVTLLLQNLNVIFDGIIKRASDSKPRVGDKENRVDLINTFNSAYSFIASMLAESAKDAIESSARDGDRTLYSFSNPNYIGKLIKQLKNVRGDEKKFKEFINQEFMQYEWFYKDGRWRNDWLEQLVNDPKMRQGLHHKVIASADKKLYEDWNSLDYVLILLSEYFGVPNSSRSDVQWAYYHIPILADSTSAEFIKFRKYDNHSIVGEDGEYMSYEDIILDRMVDVVNQEVDRIALVNEMDEAYQKGTLNTLPIANFNIVRGKDGSISKIGGAEFKFIPALNTVKYEDGKTFLEKLQEIHENGTGEDLRTFIKETLREVITNEFEETYEKWYSMGLMEELPNGNYKYLGAIGLSVGQKLYTDSITKSLQEAQDKLGNQWTVEMSRLLSDFKRNIPVRDRRASFLFSTISSLLRNKVEEGTLSQREMERISRGLSVRNNAKEKLREYFWNSYLATSQIIELTTTDLAFYKNTEDFQKRFKEIYAPSLRLNTGSKYGRKVERTVYLKDSVVVSSAYSDIKEALNEAYMQGNLNEKDLESILSKFKEVNVADAQAYRSLSSYRAVLDMAGKWTDEMQEAFDHFQNGTWDMQDFNIIWQPLKPYVYTQTQVSTGLEGYSDIKVPVQHKNSELPLLALYPFVANALGKSSKLKAINKFMEDKGIDVIQFESAVKTGNQGKINLEGANTEKEVLKVLTDAAFPGGVENRAVVHTVSYEDYGFQNNVPEHAIDRTQLMGTQIRKLITADISEDAVIEVSGKKMSKKEWLDLYNKVTLENVLQSYLSVSKEMDSPKNVEKLLQKEMRGNQRYSADMVKACTLNEEGQFNVPIFDPIQSIKIQTILFSSIKKEITKQKIKGGSLVQASAYGLTDDLHIIFEGTGKNKRIKYFECYMPAYTKDFYEPLMDPETHVLDINRKDSSGNPILPEELRRLVGYRIPTEDKYSMIPLRIKGFTPQQNGSIIMLPEEITTLSGSDFDIDKLFIMLPEFRRVPKYDRKRFVYDLVNQLTKGKKVSKEKLAEYRKSIQQAIDEGRNAEEGTQEHDVWMTYLANREQYRVEGEYRFEKVKYDFDRSPQENSLQARNNLLMDMMYGILTNPDTVSKMLNPGGFEPQKKAARIISLLQSASLDELGNELGLSHGQDILGVLAGLDVDSLNDLSEKFKKNLSPLNPMIQIEAHQRNMTGAQLIGVYANHNANHALMQHTELGLSEENGSFVLNDKRLLSLHDTRNREGQVISKNNAGFLAASVDNAKDPILAALNQNMFTVDVSMLLSRLGHLPLEIGLLMSQPIVMEMTVSYFRGGATGPKQQVIKKVLSEYMKKASVTEEENFKNYSAEIFLNEDLAENIAMQGRIGSLSTEKQVFFYKRQAAVGLLFQRIMTTSDALSQLVIATKEDTDRGSAGPTIADTQNLLQKVGDFIESATEDPKFPLVNADVLKVIDIRGKSVDEVRRLLLDSPLPYLQAFYTLGVYQTQEMLGKYFPQFTESFKAVIEGSDTIKGLRQYTKRGTLNTKTLNNIYDELLVYIMSGIPFFGNEDARSSNGGIILSEEKRYNFINKFPEYFTETVGSDPRIAELDFIKRLSIMKANRRIPVDTVVFKNVGKLSPALKEKYSKDWESLLYMGPKAQALALNLLRYSFYRNGFAFGPSSFIHLAPLMLRQVIPGYIETLRNLMETEDNYGPFVEQYIYNHLNNRQLVHEVSGETSISFTDGDGKIQDLVNVIIDNNSLEGDMKVVQSSVTVEGEMLCTFFDFIAYKTKDGYAYYRLVSPDNGISSMASYQRIQPLGSPHNFIEYEYGKEAVEMKSVLPEREEEIGQEDMEDYEEDTGNPDFDSGKTDREREEALKAPDEAFSQVYDTKLETRKEEPDDLDFFPPNTEYRDANNEKLCGAELLGEL